MAYYSVKEMSLWLVPLTCEIAAYHSSHHHHHLLRLKRKQCLCFAINTSILPPVRVCVSGCVNRHARNYRAKMFILIMINDHAAGIQEKSVMPPNKADICGNM